MNIVTTHRSPHFSARNHSAIVNCIVLHADADSKVGDAISYICTPGLADPPVSYHADIGRTGVIYEMVDPSEKAWHAGVSAFDGVPDCNEYSVGVCLSNKNDGIEPFPEDQLRAGAEYCAHLMSDFPAIALQRITTHAIVALPLGRKHDPPVQTFNLSQFRELVADYRKQLA